MWEDITLVLISFTQGILSLILLYLDTTNAPIACRTTTQQPDNNQIKYPPGLSKEALLQQVVPLTEWIRYRANNHLYLIRMATFNLRWGGSRRSLCYLKYGTRKRGWIGSSLILRSSESLMCECYLLTYYINFIKWIKEALLQGLFRCLQVNSNWVHSNNSSSSRCLHSKRVAVNRKQKRMLKRQRLRKLWRKSHLLLLGKVWST